MRFIDADKLLMDNCIMRIGKLVNSCMECDDYGNCINLEITGQTILDFSEVRLGEEEDFLRWLDGTAFSHEDYIKLCEEYAKDRWNG